MNGDLFWDWGRLARAAANASRVMLANREVCAMSSQFLHWLLPAVVVVLICSGALLGAQQHGYTRQDIEGGGELYQTNCAVCHGPEGDAVAGVNLGGGRFRRATTDDELVRIIIGGIPGTAMPPSSFSEGQAGTIVAYLRSLALSPAPSTSLPGDADRGKALVEGKGQCLMCHSVGGVGSAAGPNLTAIGGVRRAIELERSILDPNAEIRVNNRSVRVVTRDGMKITGRLLNQDSFTVQLLDSTGRLRLFERSNLSESAILKDSPMPAYRERLTAQELADVVSYLVSLKGRP
jgi:putative heme-binding domain-containing protein